MVSDSLDARSVLCLSPAMAVVVESMDDVDAGERKFAMAAQLAGRGWPAEAATLGVVAWRLVLCSLVERVGLRASGEAMDAARMLPAAVWMGARAEWRQRQARARGLLPEMMVARCAAAQWEGEAERLARGLLRWMGAAGRGRGATMVAVLADLRAHARDACGVRPVSHVGGVKLKK